MDKLLRFDHILIVKKPYARLIVQGKKKWELRTTKTNIRGRIGIAESGTGEIIGEIDLVDSLERIDIDTAVLNQTKHKLQDIGLIEKWCFPWVLENAVEYNNPKKYHHKPGAVIWIKI
jgi:predicted transcriptional regulator